VRHCSCRDSACATVIHERHLFLPEKKKHLRRKTGDGRLDDKLFPRCSRIPTRGRLLIMVGAYRRRSRFLQMSESADQDPRPTAATIFPRARACLLWGFPYREGGRVLDHFEEGGEGGEMGKEGKVVKRAEQR